MRAILLDIEGTTTPVAFVYETLFPYARRQLRRYLELHDGSSDFHALAGRLRAEHEADAAASANVPPWSDASIDARRASIAGYVTWLMDHDRKSPALKELQGRIWEEGYRTGALAGEVFDDVAPALRRWRDRGIETAIFSSGSVLAQQLLFGYSSAGDLGPLLRFHFDTAVGPKTEAASYRRIASAIGTPPQEVVFVSDVVRELDAARAAGMQTVLCMRPGHSAPAAEHGHRIVRTFDELTFGDPT